MPNAAQWIGLAVQASIFLLVFALGLRASYADATYLLRRPAMLSRALIAMYIVVPVFAALLAALFNLTPVVKAALVFMAVSPVPPILPNKQLRFGGRANYVYGLLVAASLSAIVFAPLIIEILGRIFHREAHVSVLVIAKIVAISVLLPLILGVALRRFAPELAERIASIASGLGIVLLLAGMIPILIGAWPGVVALIGNGTIVAIAAVVIVGLVAGYLLGGPEPGDRYALAIASSTRHPGVALAIGTILAPGDRGIMAAILLFILISVLVAIPFRAWSKRRGSALTEAPAGRF